MFIFTKILSVIVICGVFLFSYLNQHVELTKLRLRVPAVARELKMIQEENSHFQYEIDVFESPINLIELARKPEFSYLKHPRQDKIIVK
ncbi:MAG: hypothetical protein P4L16_07470 [Chlamydiales bacterium]|nr:hypothetical protein [Chlamydiales bacterium]